MGHSFHSYNNQRVYPTIFRGWDPPFQDRCKMTLIFWRCFVVAGWVTWVPRIWVDWLVPCWSDLTFRWAYGKDRKCVKDSFKSPSYIHPHWTQPRSGPNPKAQCPAKISTNRRCHQEDNKEDPGPCNGHPQLQRHGTVTPGMPRAGGVGWGGPLAEL